MAKGITSGYVPLGAVHVSERISQYFDDKMLWCGLTYSAHPLACAAGVATLQVYEEDQLIRNAAQLGRYLGQKLEALKLKHPSVGDVRYIGLFSVIELVKDKATNQPLVAWDSSEESLAVMNQVGATLRKNGLFTFIKANMIFIVPPLCINEQQLDEGLEIIEQALETSDAACQ
jgi:taurine--2-oxoglutarate transaminase